MHRRVRAVPTAAHRLAIDTDLLGGQARQGRCRPSGKGLLKSPRIDSSHHIAQGVVRWNPVGQVEKAPQPSFLLLGKGFHPHPILDAAEYRTQHNHQN